MSPKLLDRESANFFEGLGHAASQFGCGIYLVGGAVRDLLLGRAPSEFDILLERDADEFAKYLQSHWSDFYSTAPPKIKIVSFKKYLTGKLFFPSSIFSGVTTLDYSSARCELYPQSGMPPVVRAGDLHSDILRRDFSINALAYCLIPGSFGEIVDLVKGREDLSAGAIRILHDKSFVDDPIRLVRGVRFRRRFDFAFETKTAELFNSAVAGQYLLNVPARRRADELKKSYFEPAWFEVWRELEANRILSQIIPSASLDHVRGTEANFLEALVSLLRGASDSEFRAVIESLQIRGEDEARVRSLREINRVQFE